MSCICFASLKGGVGKTSLSLNVAHAFAKRGCQTLLVDLDPTAHASRFFRAHRHADAWPVEAPLATLIPLCDKLTKNNHQLDPHDACERLLTDQNAIVTVRERLDILPGGSELRHLMWGRGGRYFCSVFPALIASLENDYDYIIFDTAPDYNILVRNALALSQLVVVPVDSSEMSIYALEEIVASASHIDGPVWTIVRSMVSKGASRVHTLTNTRLQRNLAPRAPEEQSDPDDFEMDDLSDSESYIDYLETQGGMPTRTAAAAGDNPIYLLNSLVYRTEQQNRLSFLGRTAFDTRATDKLAVQYHVLAREIEQMLALAAGEPLIETSDFFLPGAEAQR
jgi:cellulose biosynthesis protein BcsQ